MKKFIAIVMSFCIVGGSLQAVYSSAPESAVTAFAGTDSDGKEGLSANDALLIQKFSLGLIKEF